MKNKKYIVTAIAIVIGLSALGATTIYAQTNSGTNRMSNLVNAIATKFNLNTADVQAVFDAQKVQIKVQQEQNYTTRINQAVTDGKLTQDQANKILAKKAELDAFKQSLTGKTKAEIQAALKTEAAALQQWLKDNNIPQGYLPFGGHGMMGYGRGGHGMGLKGFAPNSDK